MNSKINYGLLTALIWFVSQTVLLSVSAYIRGIRFINNSMDIIGFTLFGVLSTIVWFVIGYQVRGKYVEELEYYKEQNTNISSKVLNKEFRSYFIYKRAKMSGFLFLTAMPWYLIGHLGEEIQIKDFVFLFLFLIATITLIPQGFN